MLRPITKVAIAALAALALSGLWASSAAAQPAGVQAMANAEVGLIGVTANGMTLYFNDRQTNVGGVPVSNCTGDCLDAWPAFSPMAGETPGGDYTIVEREDGIRQWAYQSVLLYTFAEDAAGDTKGHLVNNDWRVLRPCLGGMPCPGFAPGI